MIIYSTAVLLGEKELQGKTLESLGNEVGFEVRHVRNILRGSEEVKLAHIARVADGLGFNVKIEFEKKEVESTLAVQS